MDCGVLNIDLDDEPLAWLRMQAEEMGATLSEAVAYVIGEQMGLDIEARISATMKNLRRAFPAAEFRTDFGPPESEEVIQVFVKTTGSPEQLVVNQFAGGRIEKIGDW